MSCSYSWASEGTTDETMACVHLTQPHPAQAQHPVDHGGQLVRRGEPHGGEAPVAHQLVLAIEAEVGLGVAYVDGEQHGPILTG